MVALSTTTLVTTLPTTATGLSPDRPPTRTLPLSDSTSPQAASASESPPLTDVALSPQSPSASPLLLLPVSPVSLLPSKAVTTSESPGLLLESSRTLLPSLLTPSRLWVLTSSGPLPLSALA